jgi:hypothetical protein
MLTNLTVEAKGLKSVLDKTRGNKQQRITVMLSVLVDRRKLTPFIFNTENSLKERFLVIIIFKRKEKG